jgi:VIT1/CCC1 family predicted Fe2+/Mn2+ transporter
MRGSIPRPGVHLSHRSNWLRAAVLGANDGIQADICLEERELRRDPPGELRELAEIYEQRGLSSALASQVAMALSHHGALAASSSAGAALPLLVVALAPASARVGGAVVVTLIALGLLGDLGAQLGGAPRRRATVRVIVWGAVAMAITAAIGALVGAIV